jgi:hypothetical protein
VTRCLAALIGRQATQTPIRGRVLLTLLLLGTLLIRHGYHDHLGAGCHLSTLPLWPAPLA